MKGKGFSKRAIQHIYMRCKDRGVLFYTIQDRLVYYTLAAVKAKKHGIKVYAASLMFTHIHQSVSADSIDSLRNYIHDTNTSFSRLYNKHYNRTGTLFERRPGHSQKITSKEKRSNIIYVFNNHVEKGICKTAISERWSFLAYGSSDHPFSHELNRDRCSKSLKRYLNLIDRRINRLKGLEYCDLDRAFAILSSEEKEQMVDYIISGYSLIDFSIAIPHFGSFQSMITAIDSTTGGEYEIQEDYTKLKDTGYVDLIRQAESEGYLPKLYSLSNKERMEKVVFYSQFLSSHSDHLRRFFHYDFKISGRK